MPQYFLLVPLFCAHALHFISHELGEERGERSSCLRGRIRPPFPYPSSVPQCNTAAGVSRQIPGSVPRGAGRAARSEDTQDSRAGRCCSQTATYLIKQVDRAVRGPPLGHEASERHALQHLGEEVILRQPPLPKEGCLEEGSVRTVSNIVQASVIPADVAAWVTLLPQ